MKNLYSLLLTALLASLTYSASAQCKSNFSYSVDAKDSSLYTFYDSSGSAGSKIIYSYWYISDGTGTKWQLGNLTHQFKSNGTYTVCHYVEDSLRTCWDSVCYSVTVKFKSGGCSAKFTESINLDKATYTSSGTSATSYKWSFGDGTTGTGKTATHTYNFPKNKYMTYTVCLVTFDSTSNCTDSICKSLTFYKPDSCQAYFTYTQQKGVVSFTNGSYGHGVSSTTYSWTFGDGTSSSAKSLTHTYAKPGLYIACLTLQDSINGCRSTYCDSVVVDTSAPTKCSANFTSSVKNLYAVFSNTSTKATNSYWSFGDGSTSSVKNPAHSYATAGTYNVCLTISDGSGCSDSICQKVTVDSIYCNASFRLALDSSTKFKMRLYNTSSNLGSHLYNWSFGDGTYSTQRNPTHQYSTFGRYAVCLVVTDTFYGCAHTYCDSLGMDSTGKRLKGGFTMEVVEEGTASVKDIAQLGATIYPNPVTDILYIKMNEFSNSIDVQVFSLSGVLVIEKKGIENDQAKIDVQQLQNGLYILQISNGEAVSRIRFVKSK